MAKKLKKFKFTIQGNNRGEYVTEIEAKNKAEAKKKAEKEKREAFGYLDTEGSVTPHDNEDRKLTKKLG